MKKILTFLFLIASIYANAQIVFVTKFSNDTKLKVAVVNFASDADLIVYQTKFKSEIGKNNGIWYFSEFGSDTKKHIFITPFASDANFKIYYTKFASEAGWKNKSKMKLMD
jgi:hypothetical protein